MTEVKDSDWIVPDWPAPENIRAVITTRQGGVSKPPFESLNLGDHVGDDPEAVKQNREQLKEALVDSPGFQWVRQVHGNKVLLREEKSEGVVPEADGIYTQEKDIACGVLTADCLSVLFCDAAGNEIAVAHAGWRGLASGILQKTLEKFMVEPVSILAYLCPAIGPCHFEVGNDVRQAFMTLDIPEFKEQAPVLFQETDKPGKWMGDLFAIAKIILSSQGVKQIYGEPICTYCEFDRFYSYRRDGETGRFATLIWKE